MTTNSHMNTSKSYFLIFQRKEDGVTWPIISTSAGDAVAVFTDPDRAENFLRQRGFPPEWIVGAIEPIEFLRWLRSNLLDGIRHMLLDPPAQGRKSRSLSISRLLLQIEN